MEKIQVLSFVQSQLEAGSITPEDLAALTGVAAPAVQPTATTPPVAEAQPVSRNQSSIINVFYGIGAVVALTGVGILVAQHWADIGFMGRVLVSAGIAAVSYAVALLMRAPGQRVLSQVFLTITGALIPLGAYVVLTENGVQFGLMEQVYIAAGGTVLFIVAWFVGKRSMALLLSVFYASWAYYAAILNYLPGVSFRSDIFTWAIIVAGLAYVLIGASSPLAQGDGGAAKEGRSVKTVLYALGTLAVLGAGFTLDGMWDLVYIPLVFGACYLSVYLHSRAMLVFGSLFLIGHLIYLTSKYFVGTIGWPISLVICGFIIIGVGYATYYVMSRFIGKK